MLSGPRLVSASKRPMYLSMVVTVVTAGLANLILEFFQTGGDIASLSRFLWGAPAARFLLAVVVLWAVVAIVVAMIGRLWLGAGLALAAAAIVGFANQTKMQWRMEPIYPSDFAMTGHAGFFVRLIGAGPVLQVIVLAAGLLVTTLWLGRLVRGRFPRITEPSPGNRRSNLFARLTTIAVCAAFLAYAAHFNSAGNRFRAAFNAAGARWPAAQAEANYERNGVVAGFLYNLNAPSMTEPGGYSPAAMRRIVAEYTRVATAMNADRDPEALQGVNVVVVLSESFSDPTRLDGLTPAEDPIPFTRALMGRTRSGNVLAQGIGGGTANMEFETLTSMSLSMFAPQMNTPYQGLVPKFRTFPSAVQFFKSKGYDAIGIHPYEPWFYRRDVDYRAMGFDDFITKDRMQDRSKIEDGHFISDEAAFHEVTHQIRTHSAPVFVNLVTMQNHGPWRGQYPDPIPVTGVPAATADESGNYLRGLRHSDEALEGFLTQSEASDERTVVLFYGDHLPGDWPRPVLDANGVLTTHQTPYFIWKNFGLPTRAPHPVISPIHFMSSVLDELDAPLPPYYAMLDALESEVPAMDLGLYLDPSGHEIPASKLSPRARQLLHDYRLVQYDLSVGHRYSERAMLGAPPAGTVFASGQ